MFDRVALINRVFGCVLSNVFRNHYCRVRLAAGVEDYQTYGESSQRFCVNFGAIDDELFRFFLQSLFRPSRFR